MPYTLHAATVADPRQPMAVALGEESTSLRLPIGPIAAPLAPRRTHDINRSPRGAIRIPLGELRSLAAEMDERDAQNPERRPGNWVKRFDHFDLMVPEIGRGLRKEDRAIELDGLKQLLGLPGAGKTTLLMLSGVWFGRHGYKAMLVFPSIEVARQYMADLDFYGVKVGMLVGQNPMTRRQHADRIAEAIAARGQGGFAQTIEGADSFAANCVLPAFSTADTSMWGFGQAPCQSILQGMTRSGQMKKCLCPVWTMCGRNKAPRELLDAEVWVGHIRSMDTEVPLHAINEQIRYFELIARTFDVVIFDEADMVQSTLDEYGTALLKISGDEESIHRVIQEQIHGRFARGENYRLFDRDVERYSRDLAEFGNHNTSLMTAVHNVEPRVKNRYADQLLTTSRMITELLDGFERKSSKRDEVDEREVVIGFSKNKALTDFWETAAYTAFYDRTGADVPKREFKADLCARTLSIQKAELIQRWQELTQHFRRYLAENLTQRRDEVVKDITKLFLAICFPNNQPPLFSEDVVWLLVCITFMILGYQLIIPGTRTMVAEGLIRDPVVEATATPELRRYIPENILGSLSGVKYSFSQARTTLGNARNVGLSYIAFVGAPRMLMHRFHRLLEADGGQPDLRY